MYQTISIPLQQYNQQPLFPISHFPMLQSKKHKKQYLVYSHQLKRAREEENDDDSTTSSSSEDDTSNVGARPSKKLKIIQQQQQQQISLPKTPEYEDVQVSSLATSFSESWQNWATFFEMSACVKLFEKYAEPSNGDMIHAWGLVRLCNDLGFPSNVQLFYTRMLWLYTWDVKSRFQITRSEFLFGMFHMKYGFLVQN